MRWLLNPKFCTVVCVGWGIRQSGANRGSTRGSARIVASIHGSRGWTRRKKGLSCAHLGRWELMSWWSTSDATVLRYPGNFRPLSIIQVGVSSKVDDTLFYNDRDYSKNVSAACSCHIE